MPEYLLSARPARGPRFTDLIQAETGDAAVQQLLDEGCTEIVLHTDEVTATLTRYSELPGNFPPSELVNMGRRGYWRQTLFLLRKILLASWFMFFPGLGVFIWRRTQDYPWNFLDVVLLGILALPFLWVPLIPLTGPGRRYNQAQRAIVWAKWEELLDLLPELEGVIPDYELRRFRAKALAGLGRLEEGLEEFSVVAEQKEIPDWLYWGLVGDIHINAKDHDGVIAGMERALELAPNNPSILLDLATCSVRYRKDTRRAKELLARAEAHAIADNIQFVVSALRGLIALETGDAFAAKEHLVQARRDLDVIRAAPITEAFDAMLHTYLTIACAECGELAEARRHYRIAEPILLAQQNAELIARCERALG